MGKAPLRNMFSVGLELYKVVDPNLNWKRASKGKPRAIRRPRTSLIGGKSRKTAGKSLREGGYLSDQDSRTIEDMTVSESEKLGVTILGQHFSNSHGHMPLKKRKVSVLQNSSSEKQSSSCPLDMFKHLVNSDSNAVKQSSKVNADARVDRDKQREAASRTKNENINKDKLYGSADFSGISILAAVACNSCFDADVAKVDGSVSEGHYWNDCGTPENIELLSELVNKSEDTLVRAADFSDSKNGTAVLLTATPTNGNMGTTYITEEQSCDGMLMPSSNGSPAKALPSFRDARLHWDLNKVMDVWEDADSVNSQELAADHSYGDVVHDDKREKLGPLSGKVLLGSVKCPPELDSKVTSEGAQSMIQRCGNLQVPVNIDILSKCKISDQDEINNDLRFTRVSTSTEDEVLAAAGTLKVVEDNDCRISNQVSIIDSRPVTCISHSSEREDSSAGTTKAIQVSKSPKHGELSCLCSSVSFFIGETEASSDPILCRNSCSKNACHLFRLQSSVDDVVRKSEFLDNNHTLTTSFVNNQSKHHLDVSTENKNVSTDNKKTISIDGNAANGILCVVAEEKIVNLARGVEHADCVTNSETVRETFCTLKDRSEESTVVYYGLNEDTTNELRPIYTMIDRGSVNSVSLHDADKCSGDDPPKSTVEDVLEDLSDCDYDSETSRNALEQPVGMEQLHGDDDYQYEDGELREYALPSWGMHGSEEGEAELVDYGSDCRGNNISADASDNPASTFKFDVEVTEHKVDNSLLEDNHTHIAAHIGKYRPGILPKPYLQSLEDNRTETDGPENAVREVVSIYSSREGSGCAELKGDAVNAAQFDACGKFSAAGDYIAESSAKSRLSASLRMKSSGWDRLPGSSNITEDAIANVEGNLTTTQDTYIADGSRRRIVRRSRKELSSRLDGTKLSKNMSRTEEATLQSSRVDNSDKIKNNVKQIDCHAELTLRGGSSMHMLVRKERDGDPWEKRSKQWGPNQHDSSGFCSSAGFGHSLPKNAAEVAAAKVESNGFVVAPDGTVVEPNCLESKDRMPRPNAICFSQFAKHRLSGRVSLIGREETLAAGRQLGPEPTGRLSPDRRTSSSAHGRLGRHRPKMHTTVQKERFYGPIPDSRTSSNLPSDYPFSRRERNFSPKRGYRRPSRSRSRSRTFSPQAWMSPRRRDDCGLNGGAGLRLRSRSPDFRAAVRVGVRSSPHQRSAFSERNTDLDPSFRSRISPPRPSRWIKERKNLQSNFSKPEYRRSLERSPSRPLSRSHKLNVMDSPGRLKVDDYSRPRHPGKCYDFVPRGRGFRSDGINHNRRGHGNRYETVHSLSRQYGSIGESKCFRYDAWDSCRTNDSPHKNDPDISGRGGSMGFSRDFESQLKSSPRRIQEEKVHYGYSREVNLHAGSKSMGVREHADDLPPNRRIS